MSQNISCLIYLFFKNFHVILTEQDEYAEQNSHQRSGAESGRAAQSLRVARLHVSVSVAGAHAYRQRTCAAHHRETAV